MVRVDGKSSVGDDKLYDAITGIMKFPQELGLVSADFTKGIDSNMKYALNNVLDIKFVYMVSQRRNLNTANCSFINNKKFTILENTKKPLN